MVTVKDTKAQEEKSKEEKFVEDSIRMMVSVGMTADDIAEYLGVPTEELLKKYGRVVKNGSVEANFKVAERLYKLATESSNQSQALQACMFWMRVKAGWLETQVIRTDKKGIEDERVALSLIRNIRKEQNG